MRKKNFNTFILEKNIQEKLNKLFGYSAIGYYYAIIEYLQMSDSLLIETKKINKVSRDLKIKRKTLERFIHECCKIFDNKGYSLLSMNEKYIWSNNLLISKIEKSKRKTQNNKGGRRKVSVNECIKLKENELVNLTKNQYSKLIHKYGYLFIKNAINIFNEWLKQNTNISKRYLDKNNYAHFRIDGWVIAQTQKVLNSNSDIVYTPDGCIHFNKIL